LCLGLDACRLRFEELGAWSLLLDACESNLCLHLRLDVAQEAWGPDQVHAPTRRRKFFC
jgi:hypothetical protein